MAATPYAAWYKMGGYGIIGAIILSSFSSEGTGDTISSLACCFGVISFLVGGVIHSNFAAQATTLAVSGAAGAGGAAFANSERGQLAINDAKEHLNSHQIAALLTRANATAASGVDSDALFKMMAMKMSEVGITPGMLFTKLDKDGNGVLDPFEIREGFEEWGVAPPWVMGSVIDVVDTDGSGELNRGEWISIFKKIGWEADEPSVAITSGNSLPLRVSFTAPPWPESRGAWIGVYRKSEVSGDETLVQKENLGGETSDTIIVDSVLVGDSKECTVKMFDSSANEAMLVASTSVSLEEEYGELNTIEVFTQTNSSPSIDDVNDFFSDEPSIIGEIEGSDPMQQLFALLPEENQVLASEVYTNIQHQIIVTDDSEERTELQGELLVFIDEIAHRLPPESWTTVGVGAAAAGIGAIATAKHLGGRDAETDHNLEIELEVGGEAEGDETGISAEDDAEVQAEAGGGETGIGAEDDAEAKAGGDETGIGAEDDAEVQAEAEGDETETSEGEGPGLDELFSEIEAARFMSARQKTLDEWSHEMPLEIRVEKVEHSIGSELSDYLKGGNCIVGSNEAGQQISIRLPPSQNEIVEGLRSGAIVAAKGVPKMYSSAKKMIGFDATMVEIIRR